MEALKEVMHVVVEITGMLLETCGICILFWSGISSFISWIRKDHSCPLKLAEGISLTLEFLLAAEVLHTILASEISDLVILGALVVLRAAMTLEIHLEMKSEKEALKEE
jgi:uncharacterized membrane protein